MTLMACTIAVLPPVLGVSCLVVALFICYGVAVSEGHIAADFPYISHTGARQPESCVFSILFNAGSILGYLMFVMRYHLLQIYFTCDNLPLTRANRTALVLGLLSCTGIFLVGNFQASEDSYVVHMIHWISAGCGMGVGVIYIWLQACLSVLTLEERRGVRLLDRSELWVVVVRFSLASIAVVTLVIFMVFLGVAEQKFKGTNELLWSAQDGGHGEHVISTGSQWAVFFCIMISFLSYSVEFRHIHLSAPPFTFGLRIRQMSAHEFQQQQQQEQHRLNSHSSSCSSNNNNNNNNNNHTENSNIVIMFSNNRHCNINVST